MRLRRVSRTPRIPALALALSAALPAALAASPAVATEPTAPAPSLETAASSETYPAQGATWRRDGTGTTGLYVLTWPRMGVEGGPVSHAAQVWQELLTERGYSTPQTGLYDWMTAFNVRRFQRASSLLETGEVNFPTARALLGATIRREAEAAGVPVGLLCGHLAAEAMLDPRAVGANGVDLGIAQISRPNNPGVSDEEAFDEDFAIRYMARRDAAAYARFGDWRIAVVSYNSPVRAAAWKRNGYPDPLAETYANRAMVGCGPRTGEVTMTTEKTLWRLALVHLGDPYRWPEIAELNGIDPAVGPQPGQVVRLPQP